jgi:heme o synthase
MLSVARLDGWSTALEAVTCAVVMIPVSPLPVWLHMDGKLYAAVAVVLGLFYLSCTLRFARPPRSSRQQRAGRQLRFPGGSKAWPSGRFSRP